jgi:hypothetical protein
MKRIKVKGVPSQKMESISRIETISSDTIRSLVSIEDKTSIMPAKVSRVSFDGTDQISQLIHSSMKHVSSYVNSTFKPEQSKYPSLLQEGDSVLFEGKHFHFVSDHGSRRTSLDLAPRKLSLKPVTIGNFLSGRRRFSLTMVSSQGDAYVLEELKCLEK